MDHGFQDDAQGTKVSQAIRTQYHVPTHIRAAHLSAQCEAGRVVVSYNHDLNSYENHAAACRSLCETLGWTDPKHSALAGGMFDGDWYWVFVRNQ